VAEPPCRDGYVMPVSPGGLLTRMGNRDVRGRAAMVDGRERCRCDCVVNQLGRVLLIGARIVYDGDAPGFLVRCTRQVGSTPGTCLYERWIETAKVVLRFPRDWLADWRTVAANSERLTANLRPSHR
jgi:hypothetical protein